LDNQTFKIVVDSTPLILIDILLKKDSKALLGKKVNTPAQGYFFSTGGRVNKNETINNAMARIVKNEFNIELKSTFKFVGVFEYFYEVESEEVSDLPIEQHNEYQWFSIDELLESKQAHKYVKDYFRN